MIPARQFLFDGGGMLRYTLTVFMVGFAVGAIAALILLII